MNNELARSGERKRNSKFHPLNFLLRCDCNLFAFFIPFLLISIVYEEDFSITQSYFSRTSWGLSWDSINLCHWGCISAPNLALFAIKTHFANSNCFSLRVWFLSRFSSSLGRRPKLYHGLDDTAVWLLSIVFKDLLFRQYLSLHDSVLLLLVKISHGEHGRGNYQHEQGVPRAAAYPHAN